MLRFVLSAAASVVLFAGAAQASVDAVLWPKLVQHAVDHGETMDAGDYGTFKVLTRVTPLGNDFDRQADYFSAVGVFNEAKNLVFQIEVVSEKWTRTESGAWFVDQWLFSATPDGELFRSSHGYLLLDDGRVLDHGNYQETPEERERQWNLRVSDWQSTVKGG